MLLLDPLPNCPGDVARTGFSTRARYSIQSREQALVHRYADPDCAARQFDTDKNRPLYPARHVRQPMRQRCVEGRRRGQSGTLFDHAFNVQSKRFERMLVGLLNRIAGTRASGEVWENHTVALLRAVALVLDNQGTIKLGFHFITSAT